jgi:type IV secretory pathway protease TraF
MTTAEPNSGPRWRRLWGHAGALPFWLMPALAASIACRHLGKLADLGWQLQLGRMMAQAGPWLRESFVVSHLGEPLMPNAWLAQIVYAWMLDRTGWTGLHALDVALWVSGPLVAAIPARLRPAQGLALALALFVAFVVSMPTASLRPQSFASLGFGLTLVAMHRVRSWRTALLWGVPLFVVWQNLHPSVAIAALTIGGTAAVQWLWHFLGRGDRPIGLTVLALIAGAAVFATPAGVEILSFARINAAASLAFGATEWFPLWHPFHRGELLLVLASAALVAFAVAQQRGAMPAREWVPAAILFVVTLVVARFMMFYCIAIVPPLARLDLRGTVLPRTGLRGVLAGCGLAVLAAMAVCLTMPFVPGHGPDRALFAALSARRHQGTVFTDPTLGGAVILDGFPRWQVAFDGRYFLYRPDEIALYWRSATDGGVLLDTERRYHPTAYALVIPSSAALVRELSARPQTWDRAFDDGQNVLFVRK